MTIIVTGGAGFIGSNFIFHMLDKYPSYRIICLDCLTYAGNLSTLEPVMDNPNFRFAKISITDRDAVYKLFEEEHPDIVVNFAAESHVDRSIENPEVFLDTNIKGTAVLMDACRKYGIQRYHQVSTDEVYGDLPLDRPDLFFTETTPLHTSSPYSSAKRRQFIPAALTAPPRRPPTFWFWHTTGLTGFRYLSAAAPTITVLIISRRN
jgi:dTDP-glucose 4,6-dehydratase